MCAQNAVTYAQQEASKSRREFGTTQPEIIRLVYVRGSSCEMLFMLKAHSHVLSVACMIITVI